MDFLKKIAKVFNPQSAKSVTNTPFSSSVFYRNSSSNGTALQNKDYLSEYKNWPFACVQARAEEIGNIQLKLFRGTGDDKEEVKEHDLLDLLNAVNEYTTKYGLFSSTQAYKDLHGNAFWYLARDGANNDGAIREIYVLRPDRVRLQINKENPLQVQYYVYSQPDGKMIYFAPNEILHFREFNPTANEPFPHLGMGIIQAAAWAIDTDNEARKWNLAFFKNSARPDGILYTDGEGTLDAESAKRFKEEWKEEFGGSERAHNVAQLSGGLKWQEITRSQKDMDFVAQRTFSRDEILSLFRVPKAIVGITDDVNRANADASIYVFSLRTVKPLMQKLVDTLNEFLVPEYGDDLTLDFVSPVTEDREEKLAEYTAGLNNWLTRNEIRAREGLPPTENGDVFLESNLLVEVDSLTPAKKAKKKVVATKKVDVSSKSETEQRVDKFLARLPKLSNKGLSDEAKSLYIADWTKRIDVNTAPLKKKVRAFFEEQEKEVQRNLRNEMKGLKPAEYKYKAIDDILFDNADALKQSISFVTPFIKQYIKESGEAGNLAARGEGFDNTAPAIAKFVDKRANYFAESINQTTADDLIATIQEGTQAGETTDQISQRIADIYNGAKDYRTDRIARTEVSAASNFGAIEGYKQAGVEKHQWQVVSPQDEDCLENDGAIAIIGESFPDGDTEPPVHPNCICTTVPVFED